MTTAQARRERAEQAALTFIAQWECGCCPECEKKACEHMPSSLATALLTFAAQEAEEASAQHEVDIETVATMLHTQRMGNCLMAHPLSACVHQDAILEFATKIVTALRATPPQEPA